MRAVGVRGGAWLGGVNAWGDVFVDGKERLRWFVAADDRWYRPSRETTVRQREISGVPVIETRIKVPGGDAVQRVYGVADFGGAIVVEVFNDSSLPFAVAFDRGDIAAMREPSPTGVQGIDLPVGSVVFPVGHHATMRVAILIGDLERNLERKISAQELESLPSFEQVERGWLAALRVASRVDVPEASWESILTTQRCKLLLTAGGGTTGNGESGSDDDFVDLILDRAERVKLGDKADQWVDEVATATESVIRRCAKNRDAKWFEERAIVSAGMVLNRAGETRGQKDIAQAWSRVVSDAAGAGAFGSVFDVGAAIPYGLATARVVISGLARDWPRVRIWGSIAVVTHFIPDIYIFAVLREPPPLLVDGLILLVVLLSVVAIIGVIRQIQRPKPEDLKAN